VNDDYHYPYSLVSLPVIKEVRNPPSEASAQKIASAPAATIATAEAVAPANPDTVIAPVDPTRFVEQKLIEGKVIEALREIFDPEIPVNIYELGLIYDIKVLPDNAVQIKMTLTAPACPVAGSLPGEVEKKVEAIPEVKSADVELVWEPPWSRDLMSEAALLTLGML
jgi:FeS assembly SUF system protein